MKFIDRLIVTVPFSYMWLLRQSLGNPTTILDLGCGDGTLMELLKGGKKWEITGVDLFLRNVKAASKRDFFTEVFKDDIVKFVKKQIRNKKKYDVVFCSQVIEHLERERGEKFLSLVEKVALQRVIVGTPREFMEQHPSYLGNNPHQVHKSGWSEGDFRKRGYKVSGIGFSPLWSEAGLMRIVDNRIVTLFFLAISFLLSPIVYFFPKISAGILCIKDMKR